MPGKRNARSRVRGSWAARLTGTGFAVLLAGVGVAVYLIVGGAHTDNSASVLPTQVLGTQAIGLADSVPAHSAGASSATEILTSHSGLSFQPSGQVTADWTADQMAGGTYIFIYLKTGQCLAAAGPAGKQAVVLRHCDLLADQRWRPTGVGGVSGGHDFRQFANLGDGACLTRAGAQPSAGYGASLTACRASGAASQLIAFWWSSV
jgi:hypothetical protein